MAASPARVPPFRVFYAVLILLAFCFAFCVNPTEAGSRQHVYVYMPRSYCDQSGTVDAVGKAVVKALGYDAKTAQVISSKGLAACSVRVSP